MITARIPSLFVFLVAVAGGGIAIGILTGPGTWYGALNKPSFNPPNWIFGPVWTVLYVFIGIAGWRIWHRDRHSNAMKLWAAQMLLNFMWSPLFFVAQRVDVAFAIILLLLAAIIGFIVVSWRRDRASALLFLPYAAWVAFASALNGSIWYLKV